MERRDFLRGGLSFSAGLVLAGSPSALRLAAQAAEPKWRAFEVTTKAEILNPSGIVRAWLPLPLLVDTDYFKRLGDKWTGNPSVARVIHGDNYGFGMLYLEWPPSEKAPLVELSSRFMTRDRVIDLGKKPRYHPAEHNAVLKHFLQSTRFIPTSGIVAETARGVTRGLEHDEDKARAIYEWVVENTFRDPKVRGCGLGNIKAMLEARSLGGKCADLNALYVGLARSAGLPARDLYGLRCASSEEFNCLGKNGDITKAQHCRAEVYLADYGWVPLDPADVRKVALEEKPGGLTIEDPVVKRARAKLFGAWEMNYLPFNYAHDVRLPHSHMEPIPFLMYPQAEVATGPRDSLDPSSFRYTIESHELNL